MDKGSSHLISDTFVYGFVEQNFLYAARSGRIYHFSPCTCYKNYPIWGKNDYQTSGWVFRLAEFRK